MKIQALSSLLAASFISIFALVGCASEEDVPDETAPTDEAVAPPAVVEDNVEPSMRWRGLRESTNVIDCRGCSGDFIGWALNYKCDQGCN